ncbi:hypothetical protein B9Z42_12315 [Limnohabitans sp. B9-3]|nr:hypothetical protein B9Z42_12315 [Limnohabitans sp. B9-3]
MTFFGVKTEPSVYLCVQVRVKTKALSLVYLNPDHQALIERIMRLYEKGWIPKKISEHLNALGVNSWTGKQFYPELVFGIIRKARRKTERGVSVVLDMRCELVKGRPITRTEI